MEPIKAEQALAALRHQAERAAETAAASTGMTSQSGSDRDAWEKRLTAAGIQKRFWRCTFANMERFGLPEEQEEPFRRARAYADHFAEYMKRGVGLFFMGPVGTMKTSMAVAVAQEVMRMGKRVFFISMAELLDTILTMSRKRDATEAIAFEDRIRQVRLLIIDDMGAEYPRDWITNKVDAIITARYNRMLPVIITTNLSPGEAEERYKLRTYDRIKSSSIVIKTTGTSRRRIPEEVG